ncbi:uncharacterized protein BJ171DRAFT_583405 [Polychytrium aggregatum]|uniref:uncharacterized protein n=1 Tax=Polychytrium aggregatum TaxID=110093 RepID=UPI0022FE0D2A|nr:uncharacterized protein BJ171DRAFT_583405 [Polychytrium aggregatum]KAI9202919.1 hypothetical protein BJ171DRAFT_583405 [Polychytrium aggregatum]
MPLLPLIHPADPVSSIASLNGWDSSFLLDGFDSLYEDMCIYVHLAHISGRLSSLMVSPVLTSHQRQMGAAEVIVGLRQWWSSLSPEHQQSPKGALGLHHHLHSYFHSLNIIAQRLASTALAADRRSLELDAGDLLENRLATPTSASSEERAESVETHANSASRSSVDAIGDQTTGSSTLSSNETHPSTRASVSVNHTSALESAKYILSCVGIGSTSASSRSGLFDSDRTLQENMPSGPSSLLLPGMSYFVMTAATVYLDTLGHSSDRNLALSHQLHPYQSQPRQSIHDPGINSNSLLNAGSVCAGDQANGFFFKAAHSFDQMHHWLPGSFPSDPPGFGHDLSETYPPNHLALFQHLSNTTRATGSSRLSAAIDTTATRLAGHGGFLVPPLASDHVSKPGTNQVGPSRSWNKMPGAVRLSNYSSSHIGTGSVLGSTFAGDASSMEVGEVLGGCDDQIHIDPRSTPDSSRHSLSTIPGAPAAKTAVAAGMGSTMDATDDIGSRQDSIQQPSLKDAANVDTNLVGQMPAINLPQGLQTPVSSGLVDRIPDKVNGHGADSAVVPASHDSTILMQTNRETGPSNKPTGLCYSEHPSVFDVAAAGSAADLGSLMSMAMADWDPSVVDDTDMPSGWSTIKTTLPDDRL